ncbi:hypothetical protein AAFC00_003839 [Neodothiora populina]|uniref:Nitronate monooxygenase domain-containing protein n=1 Tax=Neodothiora populina TaxID=2781224 RepID=A0ABR3PFS9_9PEZI
MDESLSKGYPWTKQPLVTCAPMRLITLAPLAVSVSQAGGIGFLGAGSDTSTLSSMLDETRNLLASSSSPPLATTDPDVLPIGIGFLLWGASLEQTLDAISKAGNIPAAIWLFAPREQSDLAEWSTSIRTATKNKTKIWIQVCSVAEALSAVDLADPDVLVIQGTDAGGHGASKGAGLITLIPEVMDAVRSSSSSSSSRSSAPQQKQPRQPAFIAAGGITDGRGLASALTLGCTGICLGTRYLASPEANISAGYRNAVLAASDGGTSTIRSGVYDTLRGTTDWPAGYGGRGVVNASYRDFEAGVDWEENKRRYEEALKGEGWDGEAARLTTYAGTGVGLIREVMSAGDITRQVREDGVRLLREAASRLVGL